MPNMRPLSPGESASQVAGQQQQQYLQPKPANPNTVLMVYQGPPTTPRKPGSSSTGGSQQVGGTPGPAAASSSAAAAAAQQQQVQLQRPSVGAGGAFQASGPQAATFQRSMMVAGFDDGGWVGGKQRQGEGRGVQPWMPCSQTFKHLDFKSL